MSNIEKYMFSTAVGDTSSKVSILNTKRGLAKIKHALKKLGVDKPPIAVFGPDAGITRNYERWKSGFGYGCVIRWPDPNFAFPQIKPNACGMLITLLKEPISEDKLLERIKKVRKNPPQIGSNKLNWDIGSSNHFIEILEVDKCKSSQLERGDTVALLHTSPSEMKDIMYNFERWGSKDHGGWIDTPFGDLLVLRDDTADEYYREFKNLEKASKNKRLKVADLIFREHQVVSNPMHQGLFKRNEARLGLYDCNDKEFFPLSLRPDLPVFLLKGKENISDDMYNNHEVSDTISKNLTGINILPHGGGYELRIDGHNPCSFNFEEEYLFRLSGNESNYIFSNPSKLPYDYRGLDVLQKVKEWELGEVAAELNQRYTVKI